MAEKFTAPTGQFDITIYSKAAAGKKYPILLVLHGNAGLVGTYKEQIEGLAGDFSKLGYVVGVPQYYKNNEGNIADEDPEPKVATLAAAIQHVSGRSDADPERIGLVGYSLGARIAMHYIASDTSGRVKVLVDFFGPVKRRESTAPIQPPISTGIGNFPPTITFHDAKDQVSLASGSAELHALFPSTIDHDLVIYKNEPEGLGNHAFIKDGEADKESRKKAEAWLVKYMPPIGS